MVRVRLVLASCLVFVSAAVPAFAADPAVETAIEQPSSVRTLSATALSAAAATPTAPLSTAPIAGQRWTPVQRPSILPALYVGSAVLQAFDAYSTLSGLKAGASEANPLMKSATSSPVAFIGIKATVTVASIMAAERMWRGHNRIGAIEVMAATNGMMAMVAAHNASVLSTIR